MIGTLTNTYTEEMLKHMMVNHENWVSASLQSTIEKETMRPSKFLKRIVSGKELVDIIFDTHSHRTDYDEQANSTENEYIGSQDIRNRILPLFIFLKLR